MNIVRFVQFFIFLILWLLRSASAPLVPQCVHYIMQSYGYQPEPKPYIIMLVIGSRKQSFCITYKLYNSEISSLGDDVPHINMLQVVEGCSHGWGQSMQGVKQRISQNLTESQYIIVFIHTLPFICPTFQFWQTQLDNIGNWYTRK